MKLDLNGIRYLTKDDFRILTAIEQGMKNHEIVPSVLIATIAKIKRASVKDCITAVHKLKLIYHDSKKYDGYRLTYQGYDYLALRTLSNRDVVSSVGRKIGVGKESDIYIGMQPNGNAVVIKLARLGRTSFRNIKQKRDYLQHRKSFGNWMYISRLASLKEYAFMKALYNHGFPVPVPIEWNRHCVIMSQIQGTLLARVTELRHPEKIFHKLMKLILRLAEYGLIHGDFNEFNIIIGDDEEITMIDFPQMVSTSHPNAEEYFNRDVECVRVFFARRFKFQAVSVPVLTKDTEKKFSLDLELEASGFHKENEKELERLMTELKEDEEKAKKDRQENGGTEIYSDSDDDDDQNDFSDEELDENEVTEAIKQSNEEHAAKQQNEKQQQQQNPLDTDKPNVVAAPTTTKKQNEKFISIPLNKQIESEELKNPETTTTNTTTETTTTTTTTTTTESKEEKEEEDKDDGKASVTSGVSRTSNLSQIDYNDIKQKVKRTLAKQAPRKIDIKKKGAGGKNAFKHDNKHLKADFNSLG